MTITARWSLDADGWLHPVAGKLRHVPSPNFDERPEGETVTLAVVHAISLPPEVFSGNAVERFFLNALEAREHPYFVQIDGVRVSAHFFIRRDGSLIQFVATEKRAWHAGVSCWRGRERCNDFSIGIELEGSDHVTFEAPQYQALNGLLACLRDRYPIQDVVGHCDIAPGRKTDPGPYFDWTRVQR